MKTFARTYLMLDVLAVAVSLNFAFIVAPLAGTPSELSTNASVFLPAWRKK